jgi:predicted lipid-binding transport protein (Tim44 family)
VLVDSDTRDGPPRALLIAAVAVAAGAIIAILVFAALRQSPPEQERVAIAAAPAPEAGSAECGALLDAVPDQLGDYRRAPAADPAPAGAAGWLAAPDAGSIIMRCGVDRPAEFVVGAPIQVVDTVQWFRVADEERSTWFVVDRPVYVALTLPQGSGPTPIQEISRAVAKALPAKPIDPAPVR